MIELGKKLIQRTNKTIWQSKDGKSLVKVFNHKAISQGDVLAEAENQSRIEETGLLNVPSVKEVYKSGEDWCIAYDYVEGETLAELMEKHPEKTKEYLEKMVELQIQMHTLSVVKLHRVTTTFQERISSLHDVLSATTRYELHARLDSMPKHIKLCHLDFNPTNIIVDKNGKWFITDWAHARKGNASADIAITYIWFCMNGKEDLAKSYLSMFCAKTDTAYQYVQQWMPIAAAFMLSRPNHTEDEEEYLEKICDICDYQ